jgi:microtubule-associated protein tau
VPISKIQVGTAPSPNLKVVKSKIGSLENASYKPSGGNVKIEHRKIEIGEVKPKVAAKNENYVGPSGGQKKVLAHYLKKDLLLMIMTLRLCNSTYMNINCKTEW